jgi:hypothetical protein
MTESLAWQRRHAIHIVSELPEDTQDALTVLRLAIEVVERFLADQERPLAPVLSVVSASRSRSLSETGKPVSSPS